ncbi:hypothetical protein GCM10010254_57190 [Streptomyces chromofuscus]|nr:hypothetical protein GCM10010254_57190 [Streptomyces chromofuscus]
MTSKRAACGARRAECVHSRTTARITVGAHDTVRTGRGAEWSTVAALLAYGLRPQGAEAFVLGAPPAAGGITHETADELVDAVGVRA